MGVKKAKIKISGNPFIKGDAPNINIDQATKEIFILPGNENNDFYKALGAKSGDIIQEVNGVKYNLDNIYDLITVSQSWKENDPITVKVKRKGKESVLKSGVKLPSEEIEGFKANEKNSKLREAWLKG